MNEAATDPVRCMHTGGGSPESSGRNSGCPVPCGAGLPADGGG